MKYIISNILGIISIILFDTAFYLIAGAQHSMSVWISIIFIHIAFILLLVSPAMVKKQPDRKVFGFPVYAINVVYFVIQLLFGACFVIGSVDPDIIEGIADIIDNKYLMLAVYLIKIVRMIAPDLGSSGVVYWGFLGIQLILFIVYIWAIFLVTDNNKKIAEKTAKQEQEAELIRNLSARIRYVMEDIKDPELAKLVEKAYDNVHSSPAASNERAKEKGEELKRLTGELEKAAAEGSADAIRSCAEGICAAADARNLMLRS